MSSTCPGCSEAVQRKDYLVMSGIRFPAAFGIAQLGMIRRFNLAPEESIVRFVPQVGRRKSSPREPVSRGRPLSKEGIAVVQALKAAKDDPEKLSNVFAGQVSRLFKKDCVEVLKELQRQEEWDLSLKMFEAIRKEDWYKPDFSMYRQLFGVMWRNKQWDEMEYVYKQVKEEGLQPDYYLHRELMVAHIINGKPLLAMKMYEQGKAMKLRFNEKTYRLMIDGLSEFGEKDLAALVESEFASAFPERPSARQN